MISITVISGHEHDRKTMITILEKRKGFHIVCAGADGYDALRSAKTQRPNILIMDFRMKDITGTDLAPIIKRNSPSTAIIVMFSHKERSAADKALRAGISGCLVKHGDFDKLVSSVHCVYHGGLYLSRTIMNQTFLCSAEPGDCAHTGHCVAGKFFTANELRIFLGIALGHTDKEIAKNLNMSIGTLRNHVTRIKRKTKLRNRTQMAIFALSIAMKNRKNIQGQLADAV